MTSERDGDTAATRTTVPADADAAPSPESTLDMPRAAPAAPHRVAFARPRDPERYQVIAEHGRGGLGRVTRVHDRELGRDVAIKELLARNPIREVRFLREALITARLEHPGIVPIHEAGRWPDGTPFYAMKLVSGRPLRELIHERSAEDRLGLLHHVIAVADAMAYAHDRNIIHRDLKPANVVVGDFGETVVIDWGLAKDLTAPESSNDEDATSPSPGSDGLTEAGTVLGTPAYMSPEQQRGAQVDQRTDVFAIGVMLWELCTTEPLSLVEPAGRRRALRRAGLDEDLVAIVTKALAPEPAHRYHDASELAEDLKAFKSGARIAARRYSPLAVLTHWIRRHRAIAIATAAAIALGTAGGTAYVRNIAIERDRADAALVRVEATQDDLTREHAELTLKHAQLLLTSDPTAALDMLATYHGTDHDRASQLRAEALGRGVAVVRATPHTDNVLWMAGMPDGSIVSAGLDGTIARTTGGRSSVIASDMTPGPVIAYAPSRRLLAYPCHATTVCMLDVAQNTHVAVGPAFHGIQPINIAFSPGGERLAVLALDSVLQVFDVTDPRGASQVLRVITNHGEAVHFVGENAIAVDTAAGIQLVRMTGSVQTLHAPDGWLSDASAIANAVLYATATGDGWIFTLDPLRAVIRQPLCRGALSELRFLSGPGLATYSCQEGTVGLWDLARGTVTPRIHLDGHVEILAVSAAGDYLLASGSNGVIGVIDRATDLVTYYRGQGFRMTAIAAPTPEYPYVISGDVRGGIRAWPLPVRFARVVADLHRRFVSATFNPMAESIVATAHSQPSLAIFSPTGAGEVRTVGPHRSEAFYITAAPDGQQFATYGLGDIVELWSASAMTQRTLRQTHHGSISQVAFTAGTGELITSGRDGNLIRWTSTGAPHVVARFSQPVSAFALAPATGLAVVGTADGALWRVTEDGHIASLRAGRATPLIMRAMPDGCTFFIGYADGEVIVVDTRSGLQSRLIQATDAIRDIVVTPDGRTIAVAANDGHVRVGTRHGDNWLTPGTWTSLAAGARRLAMTSDGVLVAVCTDGVVWVWSSIHRTWLCLPTGADPSTVVVTPNGRTAVALDNEGRIISIDLETARRTLARTR